MKKKYLRSTEKVPLPYYLVYFSFPQSSQGKASLITAYWWCMVFSCTYCIVYLITFFFNIWFIIILLFVCLHLGKGFDELSKVYVASHCPSKSLVVVKQTNVDVQNPAQLEDLKVCIQNFITVITAFTVGRVSLPTQVEILLRSWKIL